MRTADGTARALKLYRKAGADARTEREVQAIKRCSHEGVARFELIDTWKDGDEEYVFSIEEFLSGGTLSARLQATGGTLDLDDVRSIGAALVDALGHVASLDLVHRDLKPDNIMFRGAGGRPVIVDFGLVRDLKAVSITKTWLPQGPGTPYFASPEQLNNEKAMIDWRSDQFSLGVVLAMCARGKHPFEREGLTPVQVVDAVSRRDAPAPAFVEWAEANGFVSLVRMVAPWPVRRFCRFADLALAWPVKGGA